MQNWLQVNAGSLRRMSGPKLSRFEYAGLLVWGNMLEMYQTPADV